eukprot:2556799-Pleurochrysis_carterae.AAC.1
MVRAVRRIDGAAGLRRPGAARRTSIQHGHAGAARKVHTAGGDAAGSGRYRRCAACRHRVGVRVR